MIYIANAFSSQMLEMDDSLVRFQTVTPEAVRAALESGAPWQSAVGHADTATVFTDEVGIVEIPHNRVNVTLLPGDVLFVGQIAGGRLPEGATRLPVGFRLVWRRVEVYYPDYQPPCKETAA